MALSTVAVTPGAGAGINVDTVSGGNTQIIKIDVGAVGAAALLAVANPLPASIVVGGAVVASGNPIPASIIQGLSTTQGFSWAKLDSAAGGNIDLVAGVGGQTIRVYAGYFTLATPTTVQFADSTPTTFTGAMTFSTGGGMFFDPIVGPSGLEPLFVTAIGKAFRLIMGAAVQISGAFAYKQS